MRSPTRILGVILILVLGAWEFGPSLRRVPVQLRDFAEERWLAFVDSRPPRDLPIRPADRARFPRGSFGIVIGPDSLPALDTKAGLASVRSGPHATPIKLQLSSAQLDTLYELALRDRLFDGPEGGVTSDKVYLWTDTSPVPFAIRAGGHEGRWDWQPVGYVSEPHPDDWKRLERFRRLAFSMMRSDSTYAALLSAPSRAY